MQKTTVYLPDELKAALERTAKETGQSEAELIRGAIKEALQRRVAPRPTMPAFYSGDGTLSQRVDELLAEGFGRN